MKMKAADVLLNLYFSVLQPGDTAHHLRTKGTTRLFRIPSRDQMQGRLTLGGPRARGRFCGVKYFNEECPNEGGGVRGLQAKGSQQSPCLRSG